MNAQWTARLEKIFKFFASIRLAIFILVSMGIMAATGTIYEARYDATYAQKLIYHSTFMHFIMGLLVVSLLSVMVDRWPWRRHHAGFVLAHIGIIFLIIGSFITHTYGVDGSISFEIGHKNHFVTLSDTEMAVYATFGEGDYKLLDSQRVDFLLHPPQKNPLILPLGDGQSLKVTDYYNYAIQEQRVVESKNPFYGPAARIQLQNQRVNLTQWLNRSASVPYETYNLGPALIVFAAADAQYKYNGGNEIVLRSTPKGQLRYEIYTKSRGGKTKEGVLPLAEAIETGWMGLQLRLLKYYPQAEQHIEYQPRERPNGVTTSAVQFEYNGEKHWIGLNSSVRLFTDTAMFLVVYRNRLLDLGFDMHLDKFEVGRYQGTNRAMSYQSTVSGPAFGQHMVYMNHPLKYGGYTFYQASFQEDNQGQPTTSILSVNRDPGRFLKYLGSLLIVSGTIIMFYFKRAIMGKKV